MVIVWPSLMIPAKGRIDSLQILMRVDCCDVELLFFLGTTPKISLFARPPVVDSSPFYEES